MTGNHNSGRRPKYLTIEKFNEFKDTLFNNHLFHLKIELRVQTFVVGIILLVNGVILAIMLNG